MVRYVKVDARIEPRVTEINVPFNSAIKMDRIALHSCSTSSPPLTIPKRQYTFYASQGGVVKETFVTKDQFFPTIYDVLSHIQKLSKGELNIYISKTETSINLVTLLNGKTAELSSDGLFGSLFGAGVVNNRAELSCYAGRVRHLLKEPILPPTINVFVNNFDFKNSRKHDETSEQRFLIASFVGSDKNLTVVRSNDQLVWFDVNQTITNINVTIEWNDGTPYIPLNIGLSLSFAYCAGRKRKRPEI